MEKKHKKLFFLERRMKKSHQSQKVEKVSHRSQYFYDARIQRQSVQKHLNLFFDENLSLLQNVDVKIKKVTKGLILYVS